MRLLKNFPFWVSVYVSVVGLVFGILTFVQVPQIDFKEPNKYFLTGISFILFILGARYGYLASRRKLEPKGISVNEIRKQSLNKIKTKAYLAKIAKEDPDPEMRRMALVRLEEMTNESLN